MAAAVKAKDHGLLLERSRELHFTIYRAAGRPHMLQVVERLWDLSARYAHMQLRAVPERPTQAMFEVKRIVDVVPVLPASSGQAAKRRASKAYHAARSVPR